MYPDANQSLNLLPQLILRQRLRMYSAKRLTIVAGILIMSVIMAALVWAYQPHFTVVAWLSSISFICFIRYLHMNWYSSNENEITNLSFHKISFNMAILATGLCWAVGIVQFAEGSPFAVSSVIYVLAATISAVSVLTMSGSVSSFLLLNIPIGCAVLYALIQQGLPTISMSVQVTAYYLMLLFFSRHLKKYFTEKITLEFKNRDLSIAEESGREQLAKMNEELEERVANRMAELTKVNKQLQESEQKFKKAFRSIPDAVVIAGLDDGIFIAVNDSVYNLSGYRPTELIGRSIAELGFWHHKEERNDFLWEIKRKKVLRNVEVKIAIKSSEVRDCELSAEIEVIDGKLCIICALPDITDRKRSEQALAESDLKFSTIFNDAPNGIVITNEFGEFIKVNRKYCEILGYEESELVGKK
ncbi:MAG: PAS domain S-box-containing protein [Gammaproteobacteria bacterium]|jgi:PAS domain S-box-containing protein